MIHGASAGPREGRTVRPRSLAGESPDGWKSNTHHQKSGDVK